SGSDQRTGAADDGRRGTRDAKYFGVHACRALAARRPEAVRRAFVHESAMPVFGELLKEIARRRRPYKVVDDAELAKVSGTRHHEGVCLLTDPLPEPDPGSLVAALAARPAARMVFLDGVGNPHNVGAILRSAAHFGAGALVGLADELPSPSGATARIAEGGAEHVPVMRWNHPKRSLSRVAEAGFCRVATVVEGGEPLYAAELPRHCVFMLGAEREGLSESARRLADRAVTIPGTGAVESLNVSVAAAVLLSEHFRRWGA
ncbi:MAG TPA: TrmH family RNA methyltransferase, partial [Sandaracinaceae bacterium LLY-WYZ-13_1]|nr:TrmH family RNA methyltransferase [Sandaracinaceae bacterium LLY-WYZ-13_1]